MVKRPRFYENVHRRSEDAIIIERKKISSRFISVTYKRNVVSKCFFWSVYNRVEVVGWQQYMASAKPNRISDNKYLWSTRGILFSLGKSCLCPTLRSACTSRSSCPLPCPFAIFGRCPNYQSLFDTLTCENNNLQVINIRRIIIFLIFFFCKSPR